VGRVAAAKGLAGRVKVEVLTDRPERLFPGELLYLEGEDEPRRVTAREGGRGAVIALSGVETRDAAEAIVGRYLEVAAEPLPAGTHYWHELLGIAVSDEAGGPLGEVVEVFRAGENEVYRVVGPAGEHLVPAVRDRVLELDVPGRHMRVRTDAEEVR
jgi:16S rRNA processing protein RimM